MRKFIVAISPTTPEQSRQISDLFKSRYGWWHWIDGFWLVTDRSDTLTCSQIRDMLSQVAPQSRKLVLDASSGNAWAGFGPTGDDSNMFKWIRNTWFDNG
jgi:hypothetical protein